MHLTKISIPKIFRFAMIAALVTFVWVAALFLADFVANDTQAKLIVAEWGYFGILMIAIISGLNVLIPVPAAAFVPIFTAAGMWLPIIILMLVIGTTIADFMGFLFGRWSRDFVESHYPKSYRRLKILDEHHHNWILPMVFVYAALLPFPNEAILIPLAILGFRFRAFLLPLILGNIVNQTTLAFGSANIFLLLFK